MSFITGAAANITATTTTSVVSKVWDHGAGQANYLINFIDNHESLANKMVELRSKRDYIKIRIQVDESSDMKRTPVVDGWLRRVEAIEHEVDLVLHEGAQQLRQKCIGGSCLRNWWTCYRLGKKIYKKLRLVVDLISKANFDIVVDKSLPSVVQIRQESLTVGMEALFDKVWNLLGKNEGKIMGIYGMGGVGKTTLLKKINNSFHNMDGKFDVVIWVVVSKEFNTTKVQKQIGERLGLALSEGDNEDTRAQRIFNVLSMKKFVVLLDDIWQQIELEAIGIPSPHNSNYNSKVVFTTRSESVCGSMEADQMVRVDVLDRDQAWILFQQKVGQETLNSHPEIPEMADEIVKECSGLPLAIITIGRAMAAKKTPREWKHAIKTLKRYASEFSGMEDKVFATLKFSYDNLDNDTARMSFLYCSLYPEDKLLYKDNLVGHWIGEGFLDEFEDLEDARDKGHDIIGNLKAACLLENGREFKEKKLVMHDIVRDLALWIACEGGKKKNKYLVQAGVGLTQAPNLESWRDAQRVSLMENHITELPEPPHCPCLLTLMLQKNPLLSMSSYFFQYMPCLRVLNMSQTNITDVPESIVIWLS